MIVSLRYPAAVSRVPPRGRGVRLGFVSASLPTEIPDVPADAPSPWTGSRHPRGDAYDDALRLPDTGDAAWRRLLASDKRPASPDAFRAFLEGGGGIRWPRGTPLCAWGPDPDGRARPDARMPYTRGEELAEEDLGRIVTDGRPAAGEAASAFASSRYRICGDGVLVRLTALVTSDSKGVMALGLYGDGPAPRLWRTDHLAAGAAEQAAILPLLRREEREHRGGYGIVGFPPHLFSAEEPDDPFAGARVVLDSHVPLIRRILHACARRRAEIPARAREAAPLLAAAVALEPMEVAAATGTCGRGGPAARGDAIRALVRAVDAVADAPPFRGEPGHDADFEDRRRAVQVGFALRKAYLPTLAPSEHEAEDADLIAGIGGPR